MARHPRYAPGGLVFHALNRGVARSTVFHKPADFDAFGRCMAEALARRPGVRLLAYCLMPNHWHLLLRPAEDGQLGRVMQRLTVTHVRRWHEHRHSTGGGHLYQGAYKSFPVQDDPHLPCVNRYVERNALRAGLVGRAQDWRWCERAPLRRFRLGQAARVGTRMAGGRRAKRRRGTNPFRGEARNAPARNEPNPSQGAVAAYLTNLA